MNKARFAGILLHPTSLPGRFGIGDLGYEAYRFVDYLESSSIRLWQILPLGPTGYGNSPYSARSTFAGNELLISPDILVMRGYLTEAEVEPCRRPLTGSGSSDRSERERVDFGKVESWKLPMLKHAAERFLSTDDPAERKAYTEFCKEQSYWLDDYALYAVLCEHYGDSRWFSEWDADIGYREPKAIAAWTARFTHGIEVRKILQFFFFRQGMALKAYASERNVGRIGDIPIFVAADSVDCWVNLRLFKTDAKGRFSVQSGVPPDFFSSTGQLCGTPIYDWKQMKEEDFTWWVQRVRDALTQTDIIRIDHFRGLESYWEVPIEATTAIDGAWVISPGQELFDTLRKEIGEIRIIAEDLGVITPEVEALRDRYEFPGMKIFQFAFDFAPDGDINASNAFLPHNYDYNCVAYTGTHDNDTTYGWYRSLPDTYRDLVRRYLARSDEDIVWSMMRQLMASCAKYAIFPMQDLLGLAEDSRMNRPSTVGESNWSWQMLLSDLDPFISARFSEMVRIYRRDGSIGADRTIH